MRKAWFSGIFLVILVLFAAGITQAITIGFEPVSQEVVVGNPVDVEIVISGLGDGEAPSLGAFDLDISFDPTILAFSTATFGDPVLGDQLDIFGFGTNPMDASITGPGVLDIWEISLDGTDVLHNSQSESFVLATLTFDTLAVGISPLSITSYTLSDAYANALTADVESGKISPVPEPATLILVGFGLGGAAMFRKRRGI